MKTYQDTETGKLYDFEDGVDPFKLKNRNLPTTLSENVILRPNESHVWLNGGWIEGSEAPKGYKPPVSSVPAYNPAWVAFLNPYTIILPDTENSFEILLEQINSNLYDGDKLSKVVTTLPIKNSRYIQALVSFDGAVAIPHNADYPFVKNALDKINQIFCAVLLGGIHTEVINRRELCQGSLASKIDIFVYQTGLHSRLRHKLASVQERTELMHPRIIRTGDLRNAYSNGIKIIEAIDNLSPAFLLHGYTAMIHQNRSDALSSLWIVVEQLTSFLWDNRFLNTSALHPRGMQNRLKSLKHDNRTWTTSVKHELLWQTKFLSEDCYAALSSARKQRNNLVHEGTIPDFDVIEKLWCCIFELLETSSGINPIAMRRLTPFKMPEFGFPEKSNFDEWLELVEKLGDK